MSCLVLVDESTANRYLISAVTLDRAHSTVVGRELRSVILPGQRGLHMRSGSDRRRGQILSSIQRLVSRTGWVVRLYDAGRFESERERRRLFIEALVHDHEDGLNAHFVFDRNSSLEKWDRQVLIETLRGPSSHQRVSHEHKSRHEELLLGIPDALVWCWARGGDWRRRIRSLVDEVRILRS